MTIELKGKRALVCGGSRGIGRAIAETFAKAGAEVHLSARGKDDLDSAVRDLAREQQQQHGAIVLDLADSRAIEIAMLEIIARGPFHILVNNSSGPEPKLLMDSTPSDLLQVFNQHMLASHRLALALLPGMRSASFGRIINVMGTSHKSVVLGLGPSVIRACVGVWAKALSREVAGYGITVNNLLAGPVAGGELPKVIDALARMENVPVKEVEERVKRDVPVGRFGTMEEIGQAALYLASAHAAFVTGTDLVIDGGSLRNA